MVFAINFFWTLAKRNEKSLYVAIWFYIATIITIAMLYIVNSLQIPTSLTHSYPIFGGLQDALVQWWYGHNDEPIQLDEIAKAAGMSKSHFCRTFKDVTSMTVTEYTTRARIAWARKELLRPACQVSEIAYKVGFQSLSQFNRSFAKIVGMAPTAFRDQEMKKAKLMPDLTSR